MSLLARTNLGRTECRIANWQYTVAPDGRYLINSLPAKHCFSSHAHYWMGCVPRQR